MARMIGAFCVLLCLSTSLPLLANSLFFNITDLSRAASNSQLLLKNEARKNGASINLTRDPMQYATGRVEYAEELLLWDADTGELTDFITCFSFVMDSSNKSEFGDGLAFFLSSGETDLSYARGGFLGIFSNSSFSDSPAGTVAVEFDTFINDWDPKGVHLGIDVDNITSAVTTPWNVDIRGGKPATAWVSYDSKARNLSVLVNYEPDPASGLRSATAAALSFVVDLRKVLPGKVTMGFSATTGNLTETHTLLSWSFNSTLEERGVRKIPAVAIAFGVVSGVIAFMAVAAGFIWCLILKRKPPVSDVVEDGDDEDDAIDDQFERERGPKRYPYQELALATRDFAVEGKLGEGGFGSVYKGRLNGVDVAIKRVSKDGKQGKKEYISEVTIISRLRHRNLVQLLGWCHDRGEFLLVYEFMPNGSLDSHLYCSTKCLRWPTRYKAALGLASALFYLHQESEPWVVHRDVKPSNVMLDSAFNAKLGDFGLARLVADDGRGLQTTMPAGTLPYMAPEYYFYYGKASKETDVYSFGIVALEIACGRRPVMDDTLLAEWVWNLYGKGAILEAADERLAGDFDRKEMECLMVVGLWCAHPDCKLRPTIQQAINVLSMEKELPNLPPARPQPIYYQPSFDTLAAMSGAFLSSTTGTRSSTASASLACSMIIPAIDNTTS